MSIRASRAATNGTNVSQDPGHLATHPGADVLFVCHGTPSLTLYGVQTAKALGAGRIDVASDRGDVLALAEKLGAHPVETDFGRRQGRYPIVVDCGLRVEGLHYALGSTEPEGICQSVSFFPMPETPVPLGKPPVVTKRRRSREALGTPWTTRRGEVPAEVVLGTPMRSGGRHGVASGRNGIGLESSS